jgi:hypothetical protein
VLGDVEETIYVVDEDDEDEESVKVKRAFSCHKPNFTTDIKFRQSARSQRCYS